MDAKTAMESGMSQRSRVCVAVRCRPVNDNEKSSGAAIAVHLHGVSQLILRHKAVDHDYVFDHVFGPDVLQEDVYKTLGVPQIEQAFDGYNSTIFAYGQTGSGKTHTMINARGEPSDHGIVPRISKALFSRVAQMSEKHATRRFLVQCSLLEVYNEVIYDLLAAKRNNSKSGGLEVKEQKGIGVYVKDLTETVVESHEKLQSLIMEGMANRVTAATKMNDSSSRSHCIVTIRLHQKDTEDSSQNTISKLNLVDLAGSERARDTGAEGALLKEGANINKSLSALGNVINALSSMAESGKRRAFVPYRDSKLTRVLQESLGGNSLCTMVATASPSALNAEETLSTLNYAKRAKFIKVSAMRNAEALQFKKVEQEMQLLQQKLGEEGARSISNSCEVEERQREDLEALQNYMKESWEDKQKISVEYEEQRREAKEKAENLAQQMLVERRRRLDALAQEDDVRLTLQSLVSLGGVASTDFHAKIMQAVKLWESVKSQARTVGLYRESVGSDMVALWKRRDGSHSGGFGDAEVAPASILVGQLASKSKSLSVELLSLLDLESQAKEITGQVVPEIAVALCEIESEDPAEAKGDPSLDLQELLRLLFGQLQRHAASEHVALEITGKQLAFGDEFRELADSLEHESVPDDAFLSQLRAAAESHQAECCNVVASLGTELLGLCTRSVPDASLSASSNKNAAKCARLLRQEVFGGWAPKRASPDEFLEVSFGENVSQIVRGVSVQGRQPCTGHWNQTHELLKLYFDSEKGNCGFLHVADKTFMRPPVRLLHEVAMALMDASDVLGWEVKNEFLMYTDMDRDHKAEFFDELISRTNTAWRENGKHTGESKVTAADVLGGRQCEETNRLIQMLVYLCMSSDKKMDGLAEIEPQWLTAFTLQYFHQENGWKWYTCPSSQSGEPFVFEGNTDASSIKHASLPRPIVASALRVYTLRWHGHPALRCEIHANPTSDDTKVPAPCTAIRRLKDDVSLVTDAISKLHVALDDRLSASSKKEVHQRELEAQERGHLENRLKELMALAEEFESRACAAEAGLLHVRAENEKLKAAAGVGIDRDNAAASEALVATDGRASEKERRCIELEAQVNELSEQLAIATDERDALRSHEEELENKLAAKDDELVKIHRNFVDLTQKLDEKEVEEETSNILASEMGRLTQQAQEFENAFQNASRECERLRNEVEQLKSSNRSLAADRQKLQKKRDKLEAKRAELVEKLQVSDRARLAARERCLALLEKERRKSCEIDEPGFSARSGGAGSAANSSRNATRTSCGPVGVPQNKRVETPDNFQQTSALGGVETPRIEDNGASSQRGVQLEPLEARPATPDIMAADAPVAAAPQVKKKRSKDLQREAHSGPNPN